MEMDSGDPSSTDHLPKTNVATAPSSTVSQNSTTVQIPPLTVVMQQAVAMQQFQFQQALLMQQAMVAQQAVTRAATVKSAAEMAVARAAEISKQLKGSDAEDEKQLDGDKSRSISRSASRSPLHSRSKSRSRSPIRYRRGRPDSRSPIRYRREYYSPSRTRDHYGYRSRGYRGYYRGGRSEYSWNMYRRGRDRDYSYRSSIRSRSRGRRRSRTKSRSPLRSRSGGRRRRSRTSSRSPKRRSHTRSPRHRRDKSTSSKLKKDEKRSHQTSTQSTSREPTRSPSVSSQSISISRPQKDESRRSSDVNVGGSDQISNAGSSSREDKKSPERKVSGSPSHTDCSAHIEDERSSSYLRKGKDRLSPAKSWRSGSPSRSLSVSVSVECNENVTYQKDEDVMFPAKDCNVHTRSDIADDSGKKHNVEEAAHMQEVRLKDSGSLKNHLSTVSNSGNNTPTEGFAVRKPIGVLKSRLDEESEYDEVLDDWRDDLKAASKEQINFTYGSREVEKKVNKGKRSNSDAKWTNKNNSFQIVLSGSTLKDDKIQDSTGSDDESKLMTAEGDILEQESIPSREDRPFVQTSRRKATVPDSSCMFVNEDLDKCVKEEDTHGLEDGSESDDGIFEGPRPAIEHDEGRVSRLYSGRVDSEAETAVLARRNGDNMYVIAPDQTSPCDKMDNEDIDNVAKEMLMVWPEKIDKVQEKARGRSRSKDIKKHEDGLSKHDKRRDRRQKHKKKHRHRDVGQEGVDGDSEREIEGDAHRARRRHRRKHKDGEHGYKDRKKRKHKHRAKSLSVSADDTGDLRRINEDYSVVRKKKAKRHKKSKRDLPDSPP